MQNEYLALFYIILIQLNQNSKYRKLLRCSYTFYAIRLFGILQIISPVSHLICICWSVGWMDGDCNVSSRLLHHLTKKSRQEDIRILKWKVIFCGYMWQSEQFLLPLFWVSFHKLFFFFRKISNSLWQENNALGCIWKHMYVYVYAKSIRISRRTFSTVAWQLLLGCSVSGKKELLIKYCDIWSIPTLIFMLPQETFDE